MKMATFVSPLNGNGSNRGLRLEVRYGLILYESISSMRNCRDDSQVRHRRSEPMGM